MALSLTAFGITNKISFNFQGRDGASSTTAYAVPTTAAIGVVPLTNWNGLGGHGSQTSAQLTDSTGAPVVGDNGSPVTISFNASDSWNSDGGTTTSDYLMMKGIIKSGGTPSVATFAFNNITNGAYALYLYCVENGGASTVNFGTLTATGTTTNYVIEPNAFSGTYTRAENQSASASRPTGNYVKFLNVLPSGTQISFSMSHVTGTDGSGLAGVQLIPMSAVTTASLSGVNMYQIAGSPFTYTVTYTGEGDIYWYTNSVLVTGAIGNSYSGTTPPGGMSVAVQAMVSNAIPSSAWTTTRTVTGVAGTQTVIRKQWNDGISGNLGNLTARADYPNSPNVTNVSLLSLFESPTNIRDDYGQQVVGYFVPPTNGTYYFAVAADDQATVYLSTDSNRANRQLIAHEDAWSGVRNYRNWNGALGMQISLGQNLVGGQYYYIEANMAEGGGGDNLAVAMDNTTNFVTGYAPIPGMYLTAGLPTGTPNITNGPVNITTNGGFAVTFSATVGVDVGFTCWIYTNGVLASTNWVFQGPISYTTPVLRDFDSGYTVKFAVTNALGLGATKTGIITINTDLTPPTLLSVFQDNTVLGAAPSALLVTFSEPLEPTHLNNLSNYGLDQGAAVTGVSQVGGTTYRMAVSGLVADKVYTLGFTNLVDWSSAQNALANTNATVRIFSAVTNGYDRVQYFDAIGSATVVSALLTSSLYMSNTPTSVAMLNSTFTPVNRGDNYGLKINGWIVAPVTGNYIFQLHPDDEGWFFLSTNDDPRNMPQISSATATATSAGGCCGNYNSSVKSLIGGKAYYFEGYLKEGGGGDYWQLSWSNALTGGVFVGLPSSALFYGVYPNFILEPTNTVPVVTVGDSQPVTLNSYMFSTEPSASIQYQWYTNGVAIPNATNGIFSIASTPVANVTNTYSCLATQFVQTGTAAWNTYTTTASNGTVLAIFTDTIPPTLLSAAADSTLTGITLTFSEPVDLTTAQTTGNYNIPGLSVQSATRTTNVSVVYLRTSTQVQNAPYTVTVSNVKDVSSSGNIIDPAHNTASFVSWQWTPGFTKLEFFTGDASIYISNLIAMPKYIANTPDWVLTTNHFAWNMFSSVGNFADSTLNSYGVRLSAWFKAPQTGNYIFYSISDDENEFYMNTNSVDSANPAGIVLMSYIHNAWNGVYGGLASGISPTVSLVKDQVYYIQALMKEGGGGDGFGMNYRLVSDPIPANNTSAGADVVGIVANPLLETISMTTQATPSTINVVETDHPTVTYSGHSATASPDSTVFYRWQRSNGAGGFTNVPGGFFYDNSSYTTAPIWVDASLTTSFRVLASSRGVYATSAVYTVTVTADLTAPTLTSFSAGPADNLVNLGFSEPLLPSTATAIGNYNIPGVAVLNATLINPSNVVLTTVHQPAGSHTLTISNIKDLSGTGNTITTTNVTFNSWVEGYGLLAEVWTGLTNYDAGIPAGITQLGNLVADPRYIANTPTFTSYKQPAFGWNLALGDTGTNWYGTRLTAWFVPPSNGVYTFYMRSDDNARLYMNTNAVNSTDPNQKVQIIGYDNCCAALGANASAGIPLTAGQYYYIQGVFGEGTGGDYLVVDFRAAGDSRALADNVAADASFFRIAADPTTVTLTVNPLPATTNFQLVGTTTVPMTLDATATVVPSTMPIHYSWQRYDGVSTFTNIPGYQGSTPILSQTLTVADSGAEYRVVVTAPGATVTETTTISSILPDTTHPWVSGVSGNALFTNVIVSFSEPVNVTEASRNENYSIVDNTSAPLGILSATVLPNGTNVVLHTAAQTSGTLYTLTVGGIHDQAGLSLVSDPTNITFTAWTLHMGVLAADVFWNEAGAAAADLDRVMAKAATNYMPEIRTTLLSFDWHSTPRMQPLLASWDNYGIKVYGWFMAPSNGVYKFYVRGDDATRFYINTNGASPAGLVEIAHVDGCCNDYNAGASVPVALNAGTPYYVEGWMKEGAGQDLLQVTFRAASDAVPYAANDGMPGFFWPGEEVATAAYFGVYSSPDAIGAPVTFQTDLPSTVSVAEGGTVTLEAIAACASNPTNYLHYQWQSSSDNATWTALPMPPASNFLCDNQMLGAGTDYTAAYYFNTYVRVVVTALPSGVSATSTVASVTVPAPPTSFAAMSAGSVDGLAVYVVFNKPLDPVTGSDPGSYNFNDGATAPTSATIMADGRTVRLTADPSELLSGAFDVVLYGLSDAQGESVDQTIYGVVLNAAFNGEVGTNPGLVGGDPRLLGSGISTTNMGADVVASGSDIQNTSDGFHYLAWQLSGNFDVKVQIPVITNQYQNVPNVWSKAGLVARPTLAANSRNIAVVAGAAAAESYANVGVNKTEMTERGVNGGTNLLDFDGPANLWNGGNTPWVRLQRVDSTFTGYYSTNGTDWILMATVNTATNGGVYPPTIYVGFGTCSHNNADNPAAGLVTAEYRHFYKPTPPTIQVTTDTPVIGLHGTATFTATVQSDPDALIGGSTWIQWTEDNVVIPGATTQIITLPTQNAAGSHTIAALIGNNGGATPATITLTVTNAAPIVIGDTLVATQNVARTFSVASDLLFNDHDPEGDAVSMTLISSNAIRFSTDFNAGLPAGTAVYGYAYVTNADGVSGTGCLKLTDATNSLTGAFFVNDFAGGLPVYGFKADFKLLVTNPGGGAADGFSFVFGTNLPNAAFPVAEDGIGSNLIVSFDNWDNGAGSTDASFPAPSVEVRWGGNTTNFNLGYFFLTNKFVSADWQDVNITLKPGGLLDVTLNGQAIFRNLATPYTTGNALSGAQFALGARTGGAYETHWIDNLSIAAIVNPAGVGFSAAAPAGTLLDYGTALGGSVSRNGDVLTYTPPVNACGLGADSFYYLVNDGQIGGSTVDMATVTLQDRTAPTITCPANIITTTSGGDVVVTFAPTVSDTCDTSPTVVCVPSSGSSFALGVTTVNCEVYDASLNTNTCSFTVTVQPSVSGTVALEGFVGASRAVRFSITDGVTFTNHLTQTLSFVGGVANYSFGVPLGTTRVSAKTAWNLRKAHGSLSYVSGVATANFTLPAGDITGDNQVDTSDYILLVQSWYQAVSAADIDGNGLADLDDYFLLANNWNEPGDNE